MNSTQPFQCSDTLFSINKPAAQAMASPRHCWFQRDYTPRDLITTISPAPVMGCSFVPSRGMMTTGQVTTPDDMTADCPPAQRSPFAGSHHAAFMAPTCDHTIWYFVQGHGCSFWAKTSLSHCHKSHSGKPSCTAKISFSSYKLNLHKAKSNNLAMKTSSLSLYIKWESWR